MTFASPERCTELLRGAGLDRPAMSEYGRVEVERRELPQTSFALLEVLVAQRVTEVRHVRTCIRREQQTPARPEQRNLSGALSRNVNGLQTAGNRELRSVVDLLIDRTRLDRRRLLRNEHAVHQSAQQ